MIPQTPWIERKFEFNFPVGLFPVIIERLRGTISQLDDMVKDLPEAKLSSRPAEKWSIKEVVGHLYDIEGLWNRRISDFLEHKETLHAADMSNSRTHESDHNAQLIHVLLKQFRESRISLISRVENMDETTACLTALHPRLQKPMRLVDSLFFAAEHDDHELTKIRNLIKT